MTIKEGTFEYKLFDKRDSFPFSTVRMPHIEGNMPQNIFCSAVKGEFLRTVCSIPCLRDFKPKTKELLERMKQQSSKRRTRRTSLRKVILTHPESFQQFSLSCQASKTFFQKINYKTFLSVCTHIFMWCV